MIRTLLVVLLLAPLAARADEGKPLDADACVEVAVRQSGQIGQAQGQVDEWKGRLKEVEANYGARLFGFTYLAPMYGVRGNGFDPHYSVDLGEWGPYVHFESTLVKPVYSFGQIEKGEHAAAERLAVEEARFQQARNQLALEVRKYYFLYLYTRSLKPALDQAKHILDDALKQAGEMYESGSGKVTAVDLNKLRYAASELQKAFVQREIGEGLALAALKHTMGLPEDAQLTLADEVLPPEPDEAIPAMPGLLQVAADKRPEMLQLKHGKAAAVAAEEAVRMAMRPVVFLAGKFGFDYAPTRSHDNNPWHADPYNGILGGVAMGLRFDIDPWGVAARGDTSHGLVEQVDGLDKFAQTGIPLEIRNARDGLVQAHEVLAAATDGAMAAKKWMMFAGTAYSTGTGEARDVLEGVGAYVQAKKGYYDALLGLHTARAQLRYTIGDVALSSVPVVPVSAPSSAPAPAGTAPAAAPAAEGASPAPAPAPEAVPAKP